MIGISESARVNAVIVVVKVTIVIVVIAVGYAYIKPENYMPSFRRTPAPSANSASAASCAPRP